jgi:hypothetical protein
MSKCTPLTTAPCVACGTRERERSACPLCRQVFCQRCAERPYAFCCNDGVIIPRRMPLLMLPPPIVFRNGKRVTPEDEVK